MSQTSAQRPSVLAVDDDPDQREILAASLGASGFDVVTAADGFEAIACIQARRFDVIVTDLMMPGLSGLQLLTIIKELTPSTAVIFLSGRGTMHDTIEALREGRAFDFLQKPLSDLRQLRLVIEKALVRAPAAPRPLATHVTWSAAMPAITEPLSALELQLVGLLAEGLDNRRIAERLHFSEKTVRNYLSRVYEKLDVASRLEAVAFCRRHGLVERSLSNS